MSDCFGDKLVIDQKRNEKKNDDEIVGKFVRFPRRNE